MNQLSQDDFSINDKSTDDIVDEWNGEDDDVPHLNSTYIGSIPIRAAMRLIRQTSNSLEDPVKIFTNAVLSFYFTLKENWLIGPEQLLIDQSRPDFIVFKVEHFSPYIDVIDDVTTPTIISPHIFIECKPKNGKLKAAMGQLSLYLAASQVDRCFAIIIIGTQIGFYQYFDTDKFPLVHFSDSEHEGTQSYIVKTNAFYNKLVPYLPSIIDTRDVYQERMNHDFFEQPNSVVPYNAPERRIAIPDFYTLDFNDHRHINHIHFLFKDIQESKLPHMGISQLEAKEKGYDLNSPAHLTIPINKA